jgi:hypothetical protein
MTGGGAGTLAGDATGATILSAPETAAPHSAQKRASGESADPHSEQKFAIVCRPSIR